MEQFGTAAALAARAPAFSTASTHRVTITDIDRRRELAVSPHGAEAEARIRAYARGIGLLDHLGERRFDAFNSIARYVYSYAQPDRLVACARWLSVLFFIDDQFDENRELGRNEGQVFALIDGFLELLRDGTPLDDQPLLTRLTLDARADFERLASPEWFTHFCRSTEDYLVRGVSHAVRSWRHHEPPSVAGYMATRDSDSGMYTCIDLVEVAAGIDLPQRIRDDKRVRAMRRLCARHVAFANDVVSYDKEVRCHDNPANLLHLIHREVHSLDEAARQVVALINGDMDAFERLASDLPDWGQEQRAAVDAYVEGMHRWMRGNLDWSLASLRYCTPSNPFHELRAGYERAVAALAEAEAT